MVIKRKMLAVEAESNFSVIGIACNIPDYRFMHFLNKTGNFNFNRYEEFDINKKANKVEDLSNDNQLNLDETNNNNRICFPFYLFEDNENYTSYYFLSNKNEGNILINEWKQFDYLMVSRNKLTEIKLKVLLQYLKEIPGVITASNMLISKKLAFEELLPQMEMHIMEINRKNDKKNKEKDENFFSNY